MSPHQHCAIVQQRTSPETLIKLPSLWDLGPISTSLRLTNSTAYSLCESHRVIFLTVDRYRTSFVDQNLLLYRELCLYITACLLTCTISCSYTNHLFSALLIQIQIIESILIINNGPSLLTFECIRQIILKGFIVWHVIRIGYNSKP